ncbi:MAG: chromosome partitioning protein ParA, partial [Rhodobacteraceae bacterium]|nr:chromosome partitioning protein ParA [Paracoccaceae bacterium]
EAEALTELLGHGDTGQGPGIVDSLDVEPGYEAALGAALGDDLEAPENAKAAIHWTALQPLDENPALPGKARPLADYVRGPAALARRLAQVGVVEKGGAGLQHKLRIGQRLVARDGAMWRWDGFTVSAGAPTAGLSGGRRDDAGAETEDDQVALTPERRAELTERVRADARLGEDDRGRLLDRLSAPFVPRRLVERLETGGPAASQADTDADAGAAGSEGG